MKPVPNPPKSVDSNVNPDLEPRALFHLEIVASSIPLSGKICENISFSSARARARVLFARVSRRGFFPPFQGGRSAQRGASPLLRLGRATSAVTFRALQPGALRVQVCAVPRAGPPGTLLVQLTSEGRLPGAPFWFVSNSCLKTLAKSIFFPRYEISRGADRGPFGPLRGRFAPLGGRFAPLSARFARASRALGASLPRSRRPPGRAPSLSS